MGASPGLGAVVAELLAKEGYELILTARSAPALEATAASFRGPSPRVTALAGPSLVERSYLRAQEAGDLRHEFADVHLLLRGDRARTGRRASGAG